MFTSRKWKKDKKIVFKQNSIRCQNDTRWWTRRRVEKKTIMCVYCFPVNLYHIFVTSKCNNNYYNYNARPMLDLIWLLMTVLYRRHGCFITLTSSGGPKSMGLVSFRGTAIIGIWRCRRRGRIAVAPFVLPPVME